MRSSGPPELGVAVSKQLSIGCTVTARFRASELGEKRTRWFLGTVRRINHDGSYEIEYEDGDVEARVLSKFIKIADDAPTPTMTVEHEEGSPVDGSRAVCMEAEPGSGWAAGPKGISARLSSAPNAVISTTVSATDSTVVRAMEDQPRGCRLCRKAVGVCRYRGLAGHLGGPTCKQRPPQERSTPQSRARRSLASSTPKQPPRRIRLPQPSGQPSRGQPSIPLPALHNADPARIDWHGFVEVEQLLPADLCALLADLSMDASAYPISNARELDLATSSPVLAEAVRSALSAHPTVRAAAEHLFGVTRFVVPNLKLLESLEGSAPQIPHSDDFWNRECFGICHLRPGQLPTEGVPYSASVAFPTMLWSECCRCSKFIAVPDAEARKRLHLDEGFCCESTGKTCSATRAMSEEEQQRHDATQLLEAYSELLFRPTETIARMRAIGPTSPRAGDAVLGLPTLIHRGPGQQQSGPLPRRVLFFTIQPQFSGARAHGEALAYDPDKQIHAEWLLWATEDVLGPNVRTQVRAMYEEAGYDLSSFARAV